MDLIHGPIRKEDMLDIDKTVELYDNKIDGPDNGEYRKIIIECGFKGQFGIY